MSLSWPLVFWVIASYLLGSIPTSLLVAKAAAGIDLRKVGSGNLGATNLYRQLGWRYAVPVALMDMAKGTIPAVLFARALDGGMMTAAALGIMAVIGHVFSIFARFKGGKGVATSAGVILGLAPAGFGCALVVWVIVVRMTGYVSVGSIIAAVVFPIAAWIWDVSARPIIVVFAAMSATIILLHRQNIGRLLHGTENRFGKRLKEPTDHSGAAS